MTLIFCLKCKTKTNTDGISEKISSNGRNMICGICEICGTNKSVFVSVNDDKSELRLCVKQNLMYRTVLLF